VWCGDRTGKEDKRNAKEDKRNAKEDKGNAKIGFSRKI